MRPAAPNPFIQEQLPARFVHDPRKLEVLALAEVQASGVGPPDQPHDLDTASGCVAQDLTDLGRRAVQAFVPIASPIGEVHPVAVAQRGDRVAQAGEVRGAVDERIRAVPLGPRHPRRLRAVDPGRRGPALLRGPVRGAGSGIRHSLSRATSEGTNADPRSRSNAFATRRTVCSSSTFPVICNPTGRPFPSVPHGTLMAGTPARSAGMVNTSE